MLHGAQVLAARNLLKAKGEDEARPAPKRARFRAAAPVAPLAARVDRTDAPSALSASAASGTCWLRKRRSLAICSLARVWFCAVFAQTKWEERLSAASGLVPVFWFQVRRPPLAYGRKGLAQDSLVLEHRTIQ
eukprot:5564187-Pleurochrysis_carterae.AAC.1